MEHAHQQDKVPAFIADGLELPALPPAISEAAAREDFLASPALSMTQRVRTLDLATKIVAQARQSQPQFSAERLLAVYKLSMPEGRMLMELAEALLRIPDSATRDYLIRDKLTGGHWLQGDGSGFLHGAKYALELAGKVIGQRETDGLQCLVARLGMPTVRHAMQTAMHSLGHQFVYAETIENAIAQAARTGQLFSFDMLGEAARSTQDEQRYFKAYEDAIHAAGGMVRHHNPNLNSGVSIKLSALSCRFRTRYWPDIAETLCRSMLALTRLAREYQVPITIDAEEAGRLQPSLAIFRCLLTQPDLAGWPGLGIVVQAYGRQASQIITLLETLASDSKTRIAVRLVKGAYWDSEIKIAQEKGLAEFPVYSEKNNTDLAYLAHARQLLMASRWIHPQFATHNAYTLAAVTHLIQKTSPVSCELQKLHGMGDAVHKALSRHSICPLRTYAPVGQHDDLLANLVRRLLENGANSSFMNKMSDRAVDIADLVTDPYETADQTPAAPIMPGSDLFLPQRRNSHGFDEDDASTLASFYQTAIAHPLFEPPKPSTTSTVRRALRTAVSAAPGWQAVPPLERAQIVNRVADLYEARAADFYHLLTDEAGKTFDDAVGELREAVDFCRYYATEVRHFDGGIEARGVVIAISPWNFPLAIFTGQIVAALVAGNAVIAKPAEQTPRVAALAVALMREAGIPQSVIQLLCGSGTKIGPALIAAGEADMVVFTGSTETAKRIEATIATSPRPEIPLIAETGGINAMIVDASALLERAVDDIVTSAFRSAGQRCSALRILFVQEDIADRLTDMIIAAAATLKVGKPDRSDIDIGPVIDQAARDSIDKHVESARADGRLIWRGTSPGTGSYCGPALIQVTGMADLASEVFGPVLHVARYPAGGEAAVVAAINRAGYRLTFGMHSRIDANIRAVTHTVKSGNIYVNRNQIGAVVGSQPFGGEALSGTGPKAGGPLYLPAFTKNAGYWHDTTQEAAQGMLLRGPDGEDNLYRQLNRGHILVIHPDAGIRTTLQARATALGNTVCCRDKISDDLFSGADAIDAVLSAPGANIAPLRQLMKEASPAIIPLIIDAGGDVWLRRERHLCRDLTASGGNLALLSR